MGDRCNMLFEVRASDLDKFKAMARKYFGGDDFNQEGPEDSRTGIIGLSLDEVNYGLYDLIEAMIIDPDCPPFMCHQGPGDSYSAMIWVHLEAGITSRRCVNHNGDPCLNYHRDTYRVDMDDLCVLQTFLDNMKKFDDLR